MSGQFPPKKLSVAILSRLCYLQRRLTGLHGDPLGNAGGGSGLWVPAVVALAQVIMLNKA